MAEELKHPAADFELNGPTTSVCARPGPPPQPFSPSALQPFLSALLDDQQRLQTPVAQFARQHDLQPSALRSFSPSLIPLTAPSPGTQYAFEVDLDACTGCKACVAACHALNGLDDTETWRDVGLLVAPQPSIQPFGPSHLESFVQQTVTTACHHCADPACLNGCPVLAYEKDPLTGIVRHLDDQCIGCQYCVLKCPYDVPKYNERLGIVRKCDMCHSRLAAGEAPACAQACPTSAIRIVTVQTSVNGAPRADTSAFLPGAPDPRYTQPTTRYLSRKKFPSHAQAADAETVRPQPAHWPLVFMLTLLPLAVGCTTLAAVFPHPTTLVPLLAGGWSAGAVGLLASVFHLGQPLRAWRVFLNLRKSWLSREAMAFALWFALATAWLALVLVASEFPQTALRSLPTELAPWCALSGIAALFCSVMIYVDTHRQFWRFAQTAPRFFGTAAALALAPISPLLAAGTLAAKLAWEARTFRTRCDRTSARLLAGPLRRAVGARFVFGSYAVMLLAVSTNDRAILVFAWIFLLLGELLERSLFFRAVDAPKMPGMPG